LVAGGGLSGRVAAGATDDSHRALDPGRYHPHEVLETMGDFLEQRYERSPISPDCPSDLDRG
jgi:hypothetical protein